MENTITLIRDTGYQTNISRTFPLSLHNAWEYLFSAQGIKIWLGYNGLLLWRKGQMYSTKKGTQLCVRAYNELSHTRLTYKQKDWENTATLHVRVIAAKTGTTISIHQEKLADAAQRDEIKVHWEKVMDKIASGLKV